MEDNHRAAIFIWEERIRVWGGWVWDRKGELIDHENRKSGIEAELRSIGEQMVIMRQGLTDNEARIIGVEGNIKRYARRGLRLVQREGEAAGRAGEARWRHSQLMRDAGTLRGLGAGDTDHQQQ